MKCRNIQLTQTLHILLSVLLESLNAFNFQHTTLQAFVSWISSAVATHCIIVSARRRAHLSPLLLRRHTKFEVTVGQTIRS